MTWRKWFVRSLVFTITVGLVGVGFLYQSWTSPAAVRAQVIARLGELLVGANITLESAHWRILGGISLSDLRLTRRDDPERTELFYVPFAEVFPDKEKIADGTVAIRKVVLRKPRLRITRGSDGRWNVVGILGKPHLDVTIPTIEIQQGTILFEDHAAGSGRPATFIDNVHLVLINDPLPTVTFEGTGVSELAGPIEIKGHWNRPSDDVALALTANTITVRPSLLEWLGTYIPEAPEHALRLKGTAAIQAELAYAPASPLQWTYQCSARLNDGQLQHPRLPWPLDHVDVVVRCTDGQISLDHLTAQAGPAHLQLSGSWQQLRADADCDAVLVADHLPLTHELFMSLPDSVQKIEHDFAPVGSVRVHLQLGRRAGQWLKHCVVQPEELTATFVKFPYTLSHVTGLIDQEVDAGKHRDIMRLDLTGYAGAQKIFIQGSIEGEGAGATIDLKISGDNIPLDAKLLAALPASHQKLAGSFHATGQGNFEATIQRRPGLRDANRYLVHFHDATVCYDLFPYPLENVSGILDILPEHWEFHDFQGTHKGATVTTSGRSLPTPAGDKLVIEVRGDAVVLDAEFEAALEPRSEVPQHWNLKRAWKMFAPQGWMKFRALVERPPGEEPDVDVLIGAQHCAIRPAFFPYDLTDLNGTLRYAKHWIYLDNVRARHRATSMSLDQARIFLKPEGGVYARVATLRAQPLVPDADLLRALPPALRQGCEAVHFHDPVNLTTELRIATEADKDSPDIYWDGEMTLAQTSLSAGIAVEGIRGKAACRGRYNRTQLEGLVGNILLDEATIFHQTLHQVQSELVIDKQHPTILMFPGLKAQLFGGELYGPLRIEVGAQPRFEVDLTASGIDLEALCRQNRKGDANVRGRASAQLFLSGQGTGPDDLSGRGTVDVVDARLYNLPLLLDLLKLPTLRLPDGTAFEEAHAAFAVRGKSLAISRLDLFGNAISLRGQGESNWDGTGINLDFYAVWGRTVELLPPLIKEIPPAISRQLLKIQMRGDLDHVVVTKEPVPLVVEPIKKWLETLRGRRNSRGS
jgi:hypothetical protein